jgi:hypothetical protein
MKVKKQLKARNLYINKKKQRQMIKTGMAFTIMLLLTIVLVNIL